MRTGAFRVVGACILASALGACVDRPPQITENRAGAVFADAEVAARDTSDLAFAIASEDMTVESADILAACDVDGRARVVGGLTRVSTVSYNSNYDISFDGCTDVYSTVDGRLVLSTNVDPSGLYIQNLSGDVVVHDDTALGDQGVRCRIGVHTVIQDIVQGQLVTTEGEVCDWDAAIVFPPQVITH